MIQQSPIIARIVEPKEKTIYDVVYGSLGLAGVMVVLAVLAAVIFAGLLFWIRSRSETVHLHVDTTAETPRSSPPSTTPDTSGSR